MGILIWKDNGCCGRYTNAILQTHMMNQDDNELNNKKSNSNLLNNNYNESDSSDNEEAQKKFKQNLFKTGILNENNGLNEDKVNNNNIFINSYNNNNNVFYYLKKVILIQKIYKKHYERKGSKRKKAHFAKELVKVIDDNESKNKYLIKGKDQENNLFFNISKTKLSFVYLFPNSKEGLTAELIPFNLNSKNKIQFNYYGELITKEIEIDNKKSRFSINKNPKFIIQKLKNGFGIIKYKDKTMFKGFFKNNFANGIGSYEDEINGNFIGEYIENEPNGYGIYNNSGIQVEGYFYNNHLNGIGIERSDDDTYYEGEFKFSLKHGIGTFKWSDGTIYKGNFINNEMTGFGIIQYSDGKLYQGSLLNGAMDGYGEFYWKKGKRFYGFYKNDKRNGFGIYIYDLNPLNSYVGFFKNGFFDGVGIKINGDIVKYGLWKRQEIDKWCKQPSEFEDFIHNSDNLKFMNVFLMEHNQLFQYILKFTQNEIYFINNNEK